MMTRKKIRLLSIAIFIWLLLAILIFGFVFELFRELRGPSPDVAFERIFGRPTPECVSDLRLRYYSHLKGDGIFLSFLVPPDKLADVIETDRGVPLYNAEYDDFTGWHHEQEFRTLFPSDFPDQKTAYRITETSVGEFREIVYKPQSGHVFCFCLIDSDINP